MPTNEQLLKLWEVVQSFVEEQEIRSAESIYQCDRVMENAYEFIEECCDVVGYHEDEE